MPSKRRMIVARGKTLWLPAYELGDRVVLTVTRLRSIGPVSGPGTVVGIDLTSAAGRPRRIGWPLAIRPARRAAAGSTS